MPDSAYYIGLMSGTSLDGIDAILVDFNNPPPKVLRTHSHPIPKKLHNSLLSTINPTWTGSLSQIGTLDHQLGRLFADAVNTLIQKSDITPQKIIAIGSHGQTLWHQPEGKHPFSMQLGDQSIITELTKITTVADFRSRDIAANGQGAPLVPAFHRSLLSHPSKDRIILNIGGIANISYLPSNTSKQKITGFDTGPGNGLIDAWINKHKNISYDKDGKWAISGTILPNILETLLNDPYFKKTAPKSTGKEAFNLKWLKQLLGDPLDQYKPQDIQATLVELTAKTIADNINPRCDEVFICGGGIHNQYLLHRLKHHLPQASIESTKKLGIDPDWMEAIAFAWLAKQTMEGKPGNLPSATGALGYRILGTICPA